MEVSMPILSYRFRRFLKLTTDVINKIPAKGDSKIQKLVKSFSVIDSVLDLVKPSQNPVDEYLSQFNLEKKHNKQFVSLFFSSIYDERAMTTTTTLIERGKKIHRVKIPKVGELFFLSSQWWNEVGFHRDPRFWHSLDFNFRALLSVLWKNNENRLAAFIKRDRDRDFILVPISDSPNPIFGKAADLLTSIQEKEKKYAIDKESRTYLLVGEPGTGKSTWAEKLCSKQQRLLRLTSDVCNKMSLEDLIFLFDSLDPDYVIIDDIDRITSLSYSVSFLLSFLETIKKSHPNISLLLTANYPKKIDKALLRPGRIDEIIEFPVQDEEDRRTILKGYLQHYSIPLSEEDLEKTVKATEGLTSAYLREVALQFRYCEPDIVQDRVAHMQRFIKSLEEEKSKDKDLGVQPYTDTT